MQRKQTPLETQKVPEREAQVSDGVITPTDTKELPQRLHEVKSSFCVHQGGNGL